MTTAYHTNQEIEHLVKKFEEKTLPKEAWTHQAHLATGLYYLYHHTFHEAICIMKVKIMTYNEAMGGVNSPSGGYHETLTVFWLSVLDTFLKDKRHLDLYEVCNQFFESKLSSKDLPLDYYDKEKLFSVEARAVWIEP